MSDKPKRKQKHSEQDKLQVFLRNTLIVGFAVFSISMLFIIGIGLAFIDNVFENNEYPNLTAIPYMINPTVEELIKQTETQSAIDWQSTLQAQTETPIPSATSEAKS